MKVIGKMIALRGRKTFQNRGDGYEGDDFPDNE
mgnify:CR=1 FL=1